MIITSENYNDIYQIILQEKLPLENIDKCYELFLEDPLDFAIVSCFDTKIKVPSYLRYLFGEYTPVFHSEQFPKEGHHEIDEASFKLIIKWLLIMIMRKEFPTVDTMINQEMDINQWLHISDYFDIPIFSDFFRKIKNILDK